MGRNAQVAGTIALVAALMLGGAGLQQVREQRFPTFQDTDESLYVTSGKALSRMTVGYRALAADLYWIRAIQYYGGIKRRAALVPQPPGLQTDYRLLYPMLDVTTTLDPRFNLAYRFGAIFLAEPQPGGAGRPDLAVALLEKGLQERPDKWEYMQDIGFVHYWWRHDTKAAADWFLKASKVPGAPWFLRSLAATTLAEGGDRQSSRLMWESIRESAEIDWLRRDAERRLLQLRALDEIDTLQAGVERFEAATGTRADSWLTLIRAKALPGIPIDPQRTPYELDSGHVRLSMSSPLFPLPEEPQHLVAPPS